MSYERKVGKFWLSAGWKHGFGIGFSIDKHTMFVEIGIIWVGFEY